MRIAEMAKSIGKGGPALVYTRWRRPGVELLLFSVSGCFSGFQNWKWPKYTVIWTKNQHAHFQNREIEWKRGAATVKRARRGYKKGLTFQFDP
jgi:hypothetical protein